MKKLLMLLTVMMFSTVMNAQISYDYWVCTGNHVNIRKGPGTRYGINELFNLSGQLNKGAIVMDLGEKRNGFIKVYNISGGNGRQTVGWVSARYLRKACYKCNTIDFRYETIEHQRFPACPECGRKEIWYDHDKYAN